MPRLAGASLVAGLTRHRWVDQGCHAAEGVASPPPSLLSVALRSTGQSIDCFADIRHLNAVHKTPTIPCQEGGQAEILVFGGSRVVLRWGAAFVQARLPPGQARAPCRVDAR